MPDLGQTAAEAKIVRWLKGLGDKVAQGDVLLEVETDKVTMEVESFKAGYLRAFLVEEGQVASAMSPIAILTDEPGESYESAAGEYRSEDRKSSSDVQSPETSSIIQVEVRKRPVATPAAKARARELGASLDRLVGTGPDGLITRRDVETAWENRKPLKTALPMAAITARSAAEIPHFYVTVDIEVSHLLRWRDRWNAAQPELRASINDVFVRAAARALRDTPKLNVRYREGNVEQRTAADLLLVMATEPGLAVVTIKDPAASSWESYLRTMRANLESAKEGRVRASPHTAPALAISNLGMFGVKQFTAIIPPGCAAVLAVGAVREQVMVKDKQMRIEEVCSLTLGSDHRLIDGVTAAKFLERIQAHLNAL
jgi:pyruvate dehydrogenase E2 component (dihydrolipoamide acetyltransferase)